EGFMQEGGHYRQLNATPGRRKGKLLESVRLSDGSDLTADQFVFACGPWLGKVFDDLPGKLIASTRQQVFFFGLAAGDNRFSEERLPAWIDHGDPAFYGIPGNECRGF